MQGKKGKHARKPASIQPYISPNQLTIEGFATPFEQLLSENNRWVRLCKLIPWDRVVGLYEAQFKSKEGRPPVNGRVVIGAIIIKHMLELTDRETILQIQENVFMQYFIGYSTFTNEEPFDASLFVDIRERLSLPIMNAISEIVMEHNFQKPVTPKLLESCGSETVKASENNDGRNSENNTPVCNEFPDTDGEITNAAAAEQNHVPVEEKLTENKGRLLVDATVAPQNITYPTDLKVLDAARVKSEGIIDKLYRKSMHGEVKPRTYREEARKAFLSTAQKKSKTRKEIYKANAKQLRYLRRNLGHIDKLLEKYKLAGIEPRMKKKWWNYLHTIRKVYEQQQYMHTNKIQTVENRIVNVHQPYVRPIVRGKDGVKVEFGSKINVSWVNGFSLIDKLSWDNFNEGKLLQASVELYRSRFGYYPKTVLADKIYCNRENRKYLKHLNIELRAKPLGRPRNDEALSNHVRPGERNPIEGKFGQAKVGYGMQRIRAKLKTTSESWIASIMLVLNLVNLTRIASSCLLIITEFFAPKKNYRKIVF